MEKFNFYLEKKNRLRNRCKLEALRCGLDWASFYYLINCFSVVNVRKNKYKQIKWNFALAKNIVKTDRTYWRQS